MRFVATCLVLVFGVTTAGAFEVIAVPANAGDTTAPHYTYNGRQTVFKAIVRGIPDASTISWEWDPGDGSSPMSGTTTNGHVIEAAYTYGGSVGDAWTAVCSVTYASVTETATYPVYFGDESRLAVRVSSAIDEGLWCLHKQMTRIQVSGQPAGYWATDYRVAATAACVEAFELHGHLPEGDYDGDPYVETVQRGLNFLLSELKQENLSMQSYGNPDASSDGVGLYASDNTAYMYEHGFAMMALAASKAPTRVATVGLGGTVLNQTYADIMQNMVDYTAWAQSDSASTSSGRGGWRYQPNYSASDNDVTRWVVMGLEAARREFAPTIPAFVDSELEQWVDFIQYTNGQSGYTAPTSTPSTGKTLGLLCEFSYLGRPVSHVSVQNALASLGNSSWGDPGTVQNYNTVGNYLAMRAARQGLSLYGVDVLPDSPDFDWYADAARGLAPELVESQGADGAWTKADPWTGSYAPMGTGLATATLCETRIAASETNVILTKFDGEADPTSVSVTISDLCPGLKPQPLAWTAAVVPGPAPTWLVFAGTTGGHGDVVTIGAVQGAMAPGPNVASIHVTDPNAVNERVVIDVSFIIETRPVISLSTTSVVFQGVQGEGDPADQVVVVSDTNSGANPHPFLWAAAENPETAWLSVAPTWGVDGDPFAVSAATGSLAAGTYAATVDVSDPDAANTPQSLSVTFSVRSRPEIALSRTAVTFTITEGDPDPSAETITVSDANVDANPIALAWSGAEAPDVAWLSLSATSGADGDSFDLAPTLGALAPGTHVATIEVTDPEASNTPQSITVTAVVNSRPEIALSSQTVSFVTTAGDPSPGAETVTVTDANGDPEPVALAWTAAEAPDVAWLSLTGASGGDGDVLTLTPDTTSLAAGDYGATVDVTDANASNSPRSITVDLTVRSRPVISTSPSTVTFTVTEGDANPSPQSVTVTDLNADANPIAMAWAAVESPDRAWLLLTNASGGSGESVSLAVTVGSLGPGTYNATVDIFDANAANSPQSVAVTVTVRSRPVITFSQSSVDFVIDDGDPDPAPESVTVTDSNSGANPISMSWAAVESPDAAWLTFTGTSGGHGDIIVLNANVAGVPPGTYNTSIVVTDASASNSPATVAVSLTVNGEGGVPDEDAASLIGASDCAPGGDGSPAIWALLLAIGALVVRHGRAAAAGV